MIKSISYWSMQNGLANTHPIADALATAKAEGFTGLELCIGTEGALSVKTTQKQCEAIRKEVDKSGVVCETLAAGFAWGFNPASDDAATRKKAVALLEAALQRVNIQQRLGRVLILTRPGIQNRHRPLAIGQHPCHPLRKATDLASHDDHVKVGAEGTNGVLLRFALELARYATVPNFGHLEAKDLAGRAKRQERPGARLRKVDHRPLMAQRTPEKIRPVLRLGHEPDLRG